MTLQNVINLSESTNRTKGTTNLSTVLANQHIDGKTLEALLTLVSAQTTSEAADAKEHARELLGSRTRYFDPLLDALFLRVKEVLDLKRLAGLDELTSIANRRTFNAALQRSVARCERSGRMLALIMIDLDDLKSINDRFGHGAGDEALRNIAEACQETVRTSDLVARLGGDEFAILLPDINLRDAEIVADRVRQNVERRSVCGESLRISLGVAALDEHTRTGEQLIEMADSELYDNKNCRRSQAEVKVA
jgi:diguanylate cyclase (GGDEF)-like protein